MIGKSCISDANLTFLSEMMLGRSNYLEIGTFDGVSISKLAAHHPTKEFVTIDDFSEGNKGNFLMNNEGNENVTFIEMDSHTALRFLTQEEKRFDLIFVDGEHTYDAVIGEFQLSYPLLSERGVLAFHDCTHKGVRKAIDEGCQSLKLHLRLFDNFLAWVERE